MALKCGCGDEAVYKDMMGNGLCWICKNEGNCFLCSNYKTDGCTDCFEEV